MWTCKEVQPLWKSSEAGPPVARRSCCVTQLSHPKALKTCLHVCDHQSSVTHESQKAEYPKSVTTIPRHVCYSATRKEWNSDICQMSLENIMLREQKKNQTQRPHLVYDSIHMKCAEQVNEPTGTEGEDSGQGCGKGGWTATTKGISSGRVTEMSGNREWSWMQKPRK